MAQHVISPAHTSVSRLTAVDLTHELHVITLLFLFLATSIFTAIALLLFVPNSYGHLDYILVISVLAGAAMYFFWLTRVSFRALSGAIVNQEKLTYDLTNAMDAANHRVEELHDLEKHKIEALNLVRELELAVSNETESLKLVQDELEQARARLRYVDDEIRATQKKQASTQVPESIVQP